jgi:hypothetical protein
MLLHMLLEMLLRRPNAAATAKSYCGGQIMLDFGLILSSLPSVSILAFAAIADVMVQWNNEMIDWKDD